VNDLLYFGNKMKTIITFGTYDVFHVGHLNLLQRAAALGDRLFVGVSTDELNYSKKQRYPIYNQNDRMKIINGLRYVNLCFEEESLDLKRHYIDLYKADVLVMGDDWKGKFDEFSDICEVVYLDRTPYVSTTQLIEVISSSDQ
jgi:glycerol-3-phosphate cytidylyltransferase